MDLWNLPTTEKDAVAFLQEKGILPHQRICSNGHKPKLYFGKQVFWKCNVKSCQQKVNMRVANWFVNSCISFLQALHFMFCWTEEMTSVKFLCVKTLRERENKKIRGKGKIVEIDESLFTKRKNNRGRVLPQQWIFSGICRETKEVFLVEVPDRPSATLMSKIHQHIEKGTIIYFDCWWAYNAIQDNGYEHFTVDHSYNFVDPSTHAHTQEIERLWGSAKWRNKRHRGTARHHLESYLAEFMWRNTYHNEDKFKVLLNSIANHWPPQIDF
ncbi:DDE Tnp IS1595 domain-containing protein [Aphis craccivora]|uniref:DDE Tnp IS1595 domain-containing protein n=1 Tax=Aphis craccivora TaxID=307492 RepID=A0A6G0YDX1_APHCR|nr:DDE Tnp IS1595 domain-containing protein [Aphis craccivora]